MDDIDQNQIQETLDEDSGNPIEEPKRRVPPQMTVVEAVEVLEQFKQRLVDDHYEKMLEDGEADVRVPMEVVDALEVMVYFANTSFILDDDL